MKKTHLIAAVLVSVAVWLSVVGYHHTHKPLPAGLNYRGEEFILSEDGIDFVHDLRWVDEGGTLHHEQHIFDTLFALIENAQRYILIDMFLFNSYGGRASEFHRDLSSQLSTLLVEKKSAIPDIAIDVITDPINTVYGGSKSEEIEKLRQAGINVIITSLDDLRDSNVIYSSWWRTFVQWFGNSDHGGWLPHPFSDDQETVTLRSYLRLLNFKANHRKVVVVDAGDDMATIIGSANPHGGSSSHSNVALVVHGPIWRSVYETESAVAKMSGATLSEFSGPPVPQAPTASATVRILTEHQIKSAVLAGVETAINDDVIKIAQFYLADRDIINALVDAASRGVEIMLVLDPNKDAFGYRKNGIPNRQTGHELVRRSEQAIKLRWYDTHGEQFHTKLFVHESGGELKVILGSANLTRRNLDNFNLELDIELAIDAQSVTAMALKNYFERIWHNVGGRHTVDMEAYPDDSLIKRFLYRVQERFGLSTF